MKFLDALVSRPAEESRWGFNPVWFQGGWSSWSNLEPPMPSVPDGSFESLVEQVHRRNGVVAGAVQARAALVSQLRPRWRRGYTQNRPGELWGSRELAVLENPVGYTRPEFFSRLEHDVCYAGNAYVVNDGGRALRLDPHRVSFVLRSDVDPTYVGDMVQLKPWDAQVVAIAYHESPGGPIRGGWAIEEVAHWAPEPDPLAWWRGQSWVLSVLREIEQDQQTQDHTSAFFTNAATPNLVFQFPPDRTLEEIRAFKKEIDSEQVGASKGFKNLYLAGGAEVTPVGSSLESLDLSGLTSGAETRIALRARIPGVILGIREGYSGSSLNAGNYGSARRMWADGWFTPHAESLMAAMSKLLTVPGGSELSYDPAAIMMLQEDVKDDAEISQIHAATIRQYIDAGFEPDTAVELVLGQAGQVLVHTGKTSVQLLPPAEGGGGPEEPDGGGEV